MLVPRPLDLAEGRIIDIAKIDTSDDGATCCGNRSDLEVPGHQLRIPNRSSS
jgi:hypothetical protein